MGQCGHQGARVHLVEKTKDIAQLEIPDSARVAYVTQTTLSVDDTEGIVTALKARFPHIEGPKKSDICYATQNRQDAVKALTDRCELILVVGSANSSNSNRLREIAERQGAAAYLIDGPEDVRREWIPEGARVGLTAGASAPELLVEAVIERLRQWGSGQVVELPGLRERVTFALPRELHSAPSSET
jgi:4-hydroxy-3-methylbut-2-enyl diphosphate reductase